MRNVEVPNPFQSGSIAARNGSIEYKLPHVSLFLFLFLFLLFIIYYFSFIFLEMVLFFGLWGTPLISTASYAKP